VQTEHVLNMTGLAGVSLYEPGELVLSAAAGTPLNDVEAALDEHAQQLAFEPPNLSRFLGTGHKPPTLGGTVAANMSGPRRIAAGAARDHVLGLRAVTGRAETVRVGGRVMKNVTGYDLCKLLAGSWGTLAVLTEVTVKVLPRPEAEATVILTGQSADEAVRAMSVALGSSVGVSGATHIPAVLAQRSAVSAMSMAASSVTVLRIEGFRASVRARRETLLAELRPFGPLETLDGRTSARLWGEIRDVSLLPADGNNVVWRLSTVASRAPDVVRNVSIGEEVEALYDWGGGLVWLVQPPFGDGGAQAIRSVLERTGGHATLMRAPPSTRGAVSVFEPQPEPVAALTRRLKAAYDPHSILNPGRMYAGV
jgi:glycolate oxidase FAD binding subunit